jgi:hypothetical protein
VTPIGEKFCEILRQLKSAVGSRINAGARRRTPLLFSNKARANERELREFARANLAHFRAPHSVTFVKELLKNRDQQDLEIYFESATDSDRSSVSQCSFVGPKNDYCSKLIADGVRQFVGAISRSILTRSYLRRACRCHPRWLY